MRLIFLAVLALAACSSDPAPTDGAPPHDDGVITDAPTCADACGAGYYCLGNRCVGEGDIGPVDAPRDLGADVGFDAGAVDSGFDVGFEAAAQEIPGHDTGVDVVTDDGTADVTVACDAGRTDAAAFLCGGQCCSVACCNGACVDTRSNVNHCGQCGMACGPTPNGTSACGSGSCVVGACNSGFYDCDHNPSNGCEANPVSDPMNCGACGVVCDSFPHTASSCSTGCVYRCEAGYADCNGQRSDGCERLITGDGGCS